MSRDAQGRFTTGNKLLSLVAVVSLLILGMAWSVSGSGWIAAGVVAAYWMALFAVWKWR